MDALSHVDKPSVPGHSNNRPVATAAHYESLMPSLEFPLMDFRETDIKEAFSTTCKCLLKHPAYAEWCDRDHSSQNHGFFWVRGKSGAGKSTLMKFAHAQAESEHRQNEIVVSFFFHARGEDLERSTNGMYRSILLQSLEQAPDLQEVLTDISNHTGVDLTSYKWTNTMLRLSNRQELLFDGRKRDFHS